MEMSIKAAIATAQVQNRFLNQTELEVVFGWLKQAEARRDTAEYLQKNARLLIDSAVQAVSQQFPEYTSVSECADGIDYCLRLIQYCLLVDTTDLLDEYLINRFDEISQTFNLSPNAVTTALEYIQNNHSLTDQAAITVNQYLNYAINTLVKLGEKEKTLAQNSNGKVEVERTYDPTAKPFWQRIVEIGEQVPKEEWDKLPRDFARNFEHYMYGAPREE
ncbi:MULTISPECIES: hypothetical protein [unclassified Coleofasciculus]|uniref:hypothetical protein n=1 Tax=unclassified Coleofasciculus TaxID=2692782 RepID=UPI00187FF6C8|nr:MULTISPECIES: hypothetical protein [unclassified Coleofasciculus]MBE9126580.1 hypothetical protein [Coleofasciculus sp. LEGE 07081]MBE9149939.1 hypothetical protein [Coleofasciculus sp. LEGE 07092]